MVKDFRYIRYIEIKSQENMMVKNFRYIRYIEIKKHRKT